MKIVDSLPPSRGFSQIGFLRKILCLNLLSVWISELLSSMRCEIDCSINRVRKSPSQLVNKFKKILNFLFLQFYSVYRKNKTNYYRLVLNNSESYKNTLYFLVFAIFIQTYVFRCSGSFVEYVILDSLLFASF